MTASTSRRRWPPGDHLEPRASDYPPPAFWQTLEAAVGDVSKALSHLAPTPVLAEHTYVVAADGTFGDQYRAPFGALFVLSGSATQLVIAQGAKAAGAPGPGPGSFIVPALGAVCVNLAGYSWTGYGGTPGALVTVQALTRPVVPSSSGTSGAALTAINGSVLPAGPTSVYARGQSAAAPAANTVLAQLAVLPAGWWQLSAVLGFGGTAEATTADNFQLTAGGVAVTGYASLYATAAANVSTPAGPFLMHSDGVNAFAIAVGATAGSAGAIYKASLQADQYNAR